MASWVNDRLRGAWPAFWPGRDPDGMIRDADSRVDAGIRAWGLVVVAPVDKGWVSVVLRARSTDHGEVILKVAPPHVDMRCEAAFADACPHAIPVIGRRDSDMTLLLPAPQPGHDLTALPVIDRHLVCGQIARDVAQADPPAEASRYDTRVLDCLDAAVDRALPLVGDPGALLEGAAAIRRLADRPRVLCHGDLHPGNVLRDRGAWKLIDAKAIVGPVAFDAQHVIDSEQFIDGDDRLVKTWAEAAGITLSDAWLGVAARAAWQIASVVTDEPHSRAYADQTLAVVARATPHTSPF